MSGITGMADIGGTVGGSKPTHVWHESVMADIGWTKISLASITILSSDLLLGLDAEPSTLEISPLSLLLSRFRR